TTRGVARTAIFLGRRRAPTLPPPLRRRSAEARLALPRVLPDDAALPPGGGDGPLAALRRHASPERHLRARVQPPPPPERPSLWRTLRGLGPAKRPPSAGDVRVRAPEPGPRRPRVHRRRVPVVSRPRGLKRTLVRVHPGG